MTTTPSTKNTRIKAKKLLALFKSGEIQIWKRDEEFQVVTFADSGSYTSCKFATKCQAFRNIMNRAANTGFDIDRFDGIATRYFRRFLAA